MTNENRRILIVDDERDIREVTQIVLELEGGWEVVTASSGAEGIAVAVRDRPDAILLDVMMPGMDGLETLKQLRKRPETQSIPVLFLTAKGQGKTPPEWGELGIAAAISKPFDPLKLVPQICSLLNWNRSE
ncbi:response regulator [Baaleninema simplex]|uniref:response regulator n=1 Tax=Baaleninema simplex TaxID=2862350 RepID=UPI0003734FD8|nr:response regulator [Baaleninema simplex]